VTDESHVVHVDPIASGDPEQMTLEILRLRDLLAGAEAKIGELSTRISRLDAERAHSASLWQERIANTEHELAVAKTFEQRNAELLASTSWKLGQILLRPVAVWRRVSGHD
jgi:hypothetical protein